MFNSAPPWPARLLKPDFRHLGFYYQDVRQLRSNKDYGIEQKFTVCQRLLRPKLPNLQENSGYFGWNVNGKRCFGSSNWKIPEMNGSTEKVSPLFPVPRHTLLSKEMEHVARNPRVEFSTRTKRNVL